MARLHEHQGKTLLTQNGIGIPRGRVASSPEEAAAIAVELDGPVVLKSQVWSTKRASHGGIRFASDVDEVRREATAMFSEKIQQFPVDAILVEEKLQIQSEYYAAVLIDGEQRRPRVLFGAVGGSGIEEIAESDPGKVATTLVDVRDGLQPYMARSLCERTGVPGKLHVRLGATLVKLYNLARSVEARSIEINPLVLTIDGKMVAADCRVALDDYSIFRHPELGIEIAREFSRPPTPLDQIAYDVEAADYRGTFYFMQLEEGYKKGDRFVGLHGSGGGGSMMAMDSLHRKDLKPANFTDTSGNPSASKIYRAAKIILTQPNIDGYFFSGSGVASQEQTNGARGLAKAFREERIDIPAVVRLGGNLEDEAVDLLHRYTADLPGTVEGYKKDDTSDSCAARLVQLIDASGDASDDPGEDAGTIARRSPDGNVETRETPATKPYRFDTTTGGVEFDHALCVDCVAKPCVEACEPAILRLDGVAPVLAISTDKAKSGGCTECLACELECAVAGNGGASINLPIPGLDAYRRELADSIGAQA